MSDSRSKGMEDTLKILVNAWEVTDHMLVLVANCVEDWYPPEATEGMPQEEFIDRLCENYLNAEGWDIEQMDTPAVRTIMRHARRTRTEVA